MERVVSTSSRGLAGWGNPTLPQSGFTLFLRVHSGRNLAAMGRGSYCKLYLGNTEVVDGSAQAGASFSNLLGVDNTQAPTHRVFRTKVLYTDQKSSPEWNEKLELHVMNPDTEILTIRVKNQLMLFCPAIGACAIPLCNVRMGEPAEQWFPLYKQNKLAGHIRLQLLLKEKDPVMHPSPVAVHESPMQRLIQQHCQQERERRQSLHNEETVRRRPFEEQERIQTELRRQILEAEERERTRIDEMAKMQAFHEQIQREEQAKVQAYLQKQLEHEEDFHAQGLAGKMSGMKVEETPEDAVKEPTKSDCYFADDVATASTSRRSSNSSGLKQSFTGSQDGSHREQVPEAVELTDVMLGEVMHDALPSSDSSDDEDGTQRNQRKEIDRDSRKLPQSEKDSNTNSPLLFPRAPDTKLKEEVPQNKLSLASLADSSSSEETSSSEEERRRRRHRRKEKKAKRKERRRRRKAKRKSRRASDGYESSSSSSSYSSSSSSSSSSSTSSDERRKRKSRKHKKTKERARSKREGKASSFSRASVPSHSNSYGPDHSNYPTNRHNEPLPPYAKPQSGAGSSSNYIESLPPQPQQKRTMAEKISTAADMASILSDMASVATSVQQLTGGGDAGGGGIPFAVPDMSQYLGGQDLSGLVGADTTAQYF
ncbi:hypothetical protein PC129_g5582 [Phytophthora cactorum]|uniref:C2 domain-containing protein n=2 Tax=Phytophthora cactorum TaxID=29920 RepID=A0A329T295_9STRA|nr:hypothetical protein Pcac1_g11722 [Phytophthora cactorum]KAG2826735.1 hypothetical protein PC112_g9166 [Phytophthora cactorum]KAG2847259.1 hypothetical protein PC111_g845 [Phytophthora cactorum]KAG2858626.1 hypothetical protein PC113_g9651 [Phytophthora cactorum]KAG2909486.1 hypothetical protein PC114_g10115 [Phytophthora cactorum]